jgi:two-component system, OmpR family, sensor histidine kinase KdpD
MLFFQWKLKSFPGPSIIPVKTIMRLIPQPRDLVRWFGATFAAFLTTVSLDWVGARATTAGMVFLLVVVWTATQAGIIISLYSALLCAFSFDFFFLPPIHTFTLAGPQEWVSMVTFAASSLVAGRVAERARRQARQAEQRREDVERLYTLSQEMMLYEEASGLVRDLPRLIQRIFALESAVLYVHDHDQFHASDSQLTELFKADMRALTTGHGTALPMPEGFSAQALMLGLRPVGALAWQPNHLSREVATAVCAQVAIAITRAIAIEANTRLEALRESERLRVALIDSLTHELRTPLTSIRAAATTLIDSEGLDEATRLDLASVVDEEASRLDLLIGEAVEMAEIDSKVVQVKPTPQSIRSLLERAVEELQGMLAPHNVVIEATEPDSPVWFDFNLLRRVLRHLLENASRYCPHNSRIIVRGRWLKDKLEFSVEDNGPGIDPADLPMVFEKFYRGKKAGTRGKGSGMGLAIVRAIVRAHGGDIEVSSSLGKGAIFRFWVPANEGASENAEAHPLAGD